MSLQHNPLYATQMLTKVTYKQFTSYRLMERGRKSGQINLGKKLFQHYIVDMYIRAENNDLSYLKHHQKKLRVEKYKNLRQFLDRKAEQRNCIPGSVYIIPAGHTVNQK